MRNVHPNTTIAFRVNNLSGNAADLTLYAYGADGRLLQVPAELWSITDEAGEAAAELADGTLYELRVTVADGGEFDLSEAEKKSGFPLCLGNNNTLYRIRRSRAGSCAVFAQNAYGATGNKRPVPFYG